MKITLKHCEKFTSEKNLQMKTTLKVCEIFTNENDFESL